jgi:hypothetical protein
MGDPLFTEKKNDSPRGGRGAGSKKKNEGKKVEKECPTPRIKEKFKEVLKKEKLFFSKMIWN